MAVAGRGPARFVLVPDEPTRRCTTVTFPWRRAATAGGPQARLTARRSRPGAVRSAWYGYVSGDFGGAVRPAPGRRFRRSPGNADCSVLGGVPGGRARPGGE